MLHTGKNETVTFTDEETGSTSLLYRNIIFIIVGLGIRALGLDTRYPKKAYIGMTDKGIFHKAHFTDGSLHHKKSEA